MTTARIVTIVTIVAGIAANDETTPPVVSVAA